MSSGELIRVKETAVFSVADLEDSEGMIMAMWRKPGDEEGGLVRLLLS